MDLGDIGNSCCAPVGTLDKEKKVRKTKGGPAAKIFREVCINIY